MKLIKYIDINRLTATTKTIKKILYFWTIGLYDWNILEKFALKIFKWG